MFFNLFDCINKSLGIYYYILNVVLFLLVIIYLMFTTSVFSLVLVIYIISMITMVFYSIENQVSYTVIFLVLTLWIYQNFYYKIVVYFSNLLCVVLVHVFSYKSPADLINHIVAYFVIYALSQLVYIYVKQQLSEEP